MGLLLVALLGLLSFLAPRQSPPTLDSRPESSAHHTPPRLTPLADLPRSLPAAQTPAALAFAAQLEAGKIPTAKLEQFLRDRGRTAENLSLAFILSRDPKYIEEALSVNPHSITALYARIAVGPYPEDSSYVDTLRKLEPDNPLWCVAAAYYRSKESDINSVIELLRTGTTLSALNDPQPALRAAEEAFRQDYLSESQLESVREARYADASTLGPQFNKLHDYLLGAMAAAAKSGDRNSASSLLATNLALSQIRAERSSLNDFIRSVRTENHLLNLAQRLQIPSPQLDRPLAEYQAASSADLQSIHQLKATRSSFFASASPEALSQFLRNRAEFGELAAIRLLQH